MSSTPTLTILVPTYNSSRHLPTFFSYLDAQDFPRRQLEIIIIDGGSSDDTLDIARQHRTRIIDNPARLAEPGIALGFHHARGQLVMILAVDNYLLDPRHLSKMTTAFSCASICAALPLVTSLPHDNILNRYLNRFTDPFNHFLYAAAASPYDWWRVYPIKALNSGVITYDFLSRPSLPLIALAQGFTIRRDFVRRSSDNYDDITPVQHLLTTGQAIALVSTTALAHNSLQSIHQFCHKQRWATFNFLRHSTYGLYHRRSFLTTWQKIKIKLWPIYALTLVGPLLSSFCGIMVYKEWLWLYHPLLCWLSAFSSMTAVWDFYVKKITHYAR